MKFNDSLPEEDYLVRAVSYGHNFFCHWPRVTEV
jgi:hypothetical protein